MPSKPRPRARKSPAKPTFFAQPDQFRAWLSRHHTTAPELLVGFYKRDSGKPSMTWPESVDQALCFGWIDGIRRRVDDVSYTIRFTPRRTGSIWSSINIKRVAELDALGHMHEAGLAAFAKRSEEKSRIYSYEQRFLSKLEPEQEKQFRANKKAWRFFQAQAPWYQRAVTHYIVSAAREETRAKRLQRIIDESARGRRIV
ncbi:MAG TPA: YdeI/OmpD-associated family protein [Gemmatimonadales bacterium]|nr:YdeI/OmpD-associated family protein [Gemmatimonadales bacterium]